jgi:hypothetical protein
VGGGALVTGEAPVKWRAAWTPLVFLVLAIAWTWPAAWPSGIPGRWPDAMGTIWFIDAAPRLLPGLDDAMTGWPMGAHYGRPDSFLLMALSVVLAFLPPAAVYGAVSVLGVTLSAWAAERLSAELGAEAPWSLLAGLGYAFCGLASTALIEGYPYHVLNPWMPLMALFWLRTLGPAARPRDGALTGVFFTLTLLSSAWLALSAAVILVGLTPLLLVRRAGASAATARRLVPAAVAAVTVLVPFAAYVAVFLAAGQESREMSGAAAQVFHQVRLSLVQLAGPGLGVDLRWHSQTNAVGATVVVLAALAPVVLRRGATWKAVLIVGGLSMLLSIAPRIDPEALAASGPAFFAGFWRLLSSSLLRFPQRLGWAWALGAGAVAGVVATRLAVRAPRAAVALFALALIDAFVVMRQPFRQAETLGAVPSAYGAHAGPVLDVFADDLNDSPAWRLWTTNLSCHHQTVHQRPNAEHCLFVPSADSPRVQLERHLIDRVMAGEAAAAMGLVSRLGFGSVVVHMDQFSAADQDRMLTGLRVVDADPVLSRDGGELVAAFAVPPSDADPQAAWLAWQDRP